MQKNDGCKKLTKKIDFFRKAIFFLNKSNHTAKRCQSVADAAGEVGQEVFAEQNTYKRHLSDGSKYAAGVF